MSRLTDLRQRVDDLARSGDDTVERVDALNELADALVFGASSPDMISICDEALAMAQRLDYRSGEAYAVFYRGAALWLTSQIEPALAILLEAEMLFREIEDSMGVARVHVIMAASYRSLGDFDQAFLEGSEALEVLEEQGDPAWQARGHLSLGMTCQEIGDVEGALKHYRKILDLRENSEEQWIVARALLGLGATYAQVDDRREALSHQLRALKTCERIGYRMGEARALSDLGNSYQRMGDRKRAREHHARSLAIREEIDQREAQCTSLLALGSLAIDEDPEEALGHLHRALEIAEGFGGKPRIYQAHLALSNAYEAQGNLQKALEHHKRYQQVLQEVSDFTSKMRVKNLKTLFDVEKQKREAEIARLKESLEEGVALGSYRLVERLGTGGMGEVWLGRHRLLARPAAVKLIRKAVLDASTRDEFVERFQREAHATASLRSPHTVQLYDFGVGDDGTFYYVMELLDGLDLGQIVERFGPLPPERVVWFMRQACNSLAEAHERGLVHRDIKPANLFAAHLGGQFDFLKVLDFGTVRAESDGDDLHLTIQGRVVGTPAFIAPEWLVERGPRDGRADLYSLGCTAFWALSGMPVFSAKSTTEMLMEHVKTQPPSVSEVSEQGIPPELDRVIMDCLAKHPDGRPANARELAERLAGIDCSSGWGQSRARDWWMMHAPEIVESRRESD